MGVAVVVSAVDEVVTLRKAPVFPRRGKGSHTRLSGADNLHLNEHVKAGASVLDVQREFGVIGCTTFRVLRNCKPEASDYGLVWTLSAIDTPP